MADIAKTRNAAVESQSHDATILLIVGATLLALLCVIVALLPLDTAPDTTSITMVP